MKRTERPISVTILAFVYIAVGTIGFAYHFTELLPTNAFHHDSIWVELIELVAIACGVFILRGQNWARWVALAWIALHVILSAFRTFPEFAMHGLFCALFGWLLFRPAAGSFFLASQSDQSIQS